MSAQAHAMLDQAIPGLRLTASDRPGMAQPVPERDIPDRPWAPILLAALLLAGALLGAWEWHWRAHGARAYYNSGGGAWAEQRRRISNGEGDATVLTGSSRVLFDVDLDTWERLAGRRPIQLSQEGTSPMGALENLAQDDRFTGRVLVGVAPRPFFRGGQARENVVRYYEHESPSERAGYWLSRLFVEPVFAFADPDFDLANSVGRLPWPERTGVRMPLPVRKLREADADRNTWMWDKVEKDTAYRAYAKRVWAQNFKPLDAAAQAEQAKLIEKQIVRAEKTVKQLQARGVQVLFVRMPSSEDFLAYENRDFSRATTWDVLLARTGAPGIHFEDYPELQGYELPEWSHVAKHERPRITEALYGIIAREHWR